MPRAIDPFPSICGFARLSMERMRRLRKTTESARLEVERVGDSLEVRITASDDLDDGLELPAQVCVNASTDPASYDLANEVVVELHPDQPVTCRFAPLAPG